MENIIVQNILLHSLILGPLAHRVIAANIQVLSKAHKVTDLQGAEVGMIHIIEEFSEDQESNVRIEMIILIGNMMREDIQEGSKSTILSQSE